MIPYEGPTYNADRFNCPHCRAYAHQHWRGLSHRHGSFTRDFDNEIVVSECVACSEYALWHRQQLIYPDDSGVGPPNADLDQNIQADYLEAASILNRSPRGAAALLRLCIQNLCKQLGEKGDNINDDVASLVRRGLSVTIQQSLDVVRVAGNNAVHPGEIDLKDDRETATKLFQLVNLIAQSMITQPKEIAALYESLPQRARDAVTKRDTASAAASAKPVT